MTIRIDRVVTRGGDGGKTSLGDGTRVAKHALRVEAYGTVDETNALIGLLRAHVREDEHTDQMLGRIQNDLFDVGADLCVPGEAGDRLRLTDAPSVVLEAAITAVNATLPPLKSFVLPAGAPSVSHAHVARTVARRTERLVVALSETETVNLAVIRYLNRLSDYLFVLARYLNQQSAGDIEWVPGANR